MDRSVKEEIAAWRKVLAEVARRLDAPQRLDESYTRGRYGVARDPIRTGLCEKHRRVDRDGKVYWIDDPFCLVCYPSAR